MKVLFHFTGLCAFVPKKPIDQPKNEAIVALVDATQSHHVPHYSLCFAEPEVYPEKLGGGGPNRTVDVVFTYEDSPLRKLRVNGCRLDREQLTPVGRKGDGKEVPLTEWSLSFANGPVDDCPDNQTQSFVNWMTPMARVGAGKVKFAVKNGNGGGLLGARLLLRQGNIKTNAFREVADKGLVRWRFDSATSPLAEEVAWEYEFADPNVVELVLKSTPLPAAHDSIVLRPKSGLVEAWIVNMPLGSIMGFDPPRPLEPLTHFEEVFKLADGNPKPVVPVPDQVDFCSLHQGPSNPKCPPALFAS